MYLSELDIKEGDYLVHDQREYAIRSVNGFSHVRLSPSFKAMMRLNATIERREITRFDVKCSPIQPASVDAYTTTTLQAPVKLLETFVMADDGYLHLVVEAVKR